jgi:outer membrane immunogenic protein
MRFVPLAVLALIAAPAAAESAFDGFYIGAVAGTQVHSGKNAPTLGTAGFLGLPATVAPRSLRMGDGGRDGAFQGGLVTGYNLSSGSFVYGVEADLIFGNITRSDAFLGAAIPDLAPGGLTTSATQRLGTRGSLRARAGFGLGENALVYATGGLAVGDVRGTAEVVSNTAADVLWTGSRDQTRWGWTAGAGAEFKLTSAISLRAEYLYTDLGRQQVDAIGNATVRSVAALNGVDYSVGLPNNFGAVRAGITVRF